ncbi:MAG TPA: ferrochelatase [Gemmatimonadaceae bacterium]|nr:ferrochelatase [Gemmatimonadaceae bacterium]
MTRAVLLMAYGTPERAEDVEPYFTHIRGGRTPSAEAVKHLQHRYEIVGGRTPLLDITKQVAAGLESELNRTDADSHRVYIGMKHWHPFIGEVVPRMIAEGTTDLTAMALAPHYSRMSIGAYQRAVEEAIAGVGKPVGLRFVHSWHLHPEFVDFMAKRVLRALAEWPEAERSQVVTVFSAHSLPEKIRTWGDPYEQQLREGSDAVARRAGIATWRVGWQSAGETGEPWIGPDICDLLATLHGEGVRNVLSVPIGFVSDHLEIAYDLDHEARDKAESLGMTLRRTPMPNADPAFVRVLASVVRAHSGVAVEA